ncbi:hypothetical protein QUA00_32340 [Microcoleus sp. T2B6]|uniref:hypothetical protein n=1 Tax=Microcoleus sp. T2B6 TaxID=3055424 RepID=UPI002FD19F98
MKLAQRATATIARPVKFSKPAPKPQIWEDATAEAQPGDYIRKPFCPIARVVGKEILADGRTCLIVTFPGCHDRHVEEWVLPAVEVIAPAAAPAPAVTRAPSKPAAASHATTTAAVTRAVIPAPTAIETDNQPPGRGDGRGRLGPIAHKKLLPSLVAIKRISSDIPASNFDQFELEVLGELSLAIGGFVVPPVLVRDSSGYKVISGHLQYHAAVLARRLNPRAGETIPAIVLEEENQSAALNQLKRLKFAA